MVRQDRSVVAQVLPGAYHHRHRNRRGQFRLIFAVWPAWRFDDGGVYSVDRLDPGGWPHFLHRVGFAVVPIIASLRVFMQCAVAKILLRDPYPHEELPPLQHEGFFSHMLDVKKKQALASAET